MYIFEITEITAEIYAAFERLIPQLSSNPVPNRAELEEIVAQGICTLMAARDPDEHGPVVGTLALVVFRTPNDMHALIEDVVVDQAARGRGVGEALTRAALERAAARGLSKVDLTARPAREAANRLYRRIGFQPRQTNVYFYTIEQPPFRPE